MSDVTLGQADLTPGRRETILKKSELWGEDREGSFRASWLAFQRDLLRFQRPPDKEGVEAWGPPGPNPLTYPLAGKPH